ncbi:MAG: UPF0223 family protein [Bacillota bacterium]
MTDHLSYPLDFEAYSMEELEAITRFLSMIEAYHDHEEKTPKVQALKKAYHAYRSILNNRSEEKRIDKAFEKQTGISIYRTMQSIESNE